MIIKIFEIATPDFGLSETLSPNPSPNPSTNLNPKETVYPWELRLKTTPLGHPIVTCSMISNLQPWIVFYPSLQNQISQTYCQNRTFFFDLLSGQ